jgi:hypothetical protein
VNTCPLKTFMVFRMEQTTKNPEDGCFLPPTLDRVSKLLEDELALGKTKV